MSANCMWGCSICRKMALGIHRETQIFPQQCLQQNKAKKVPPLPQQALLRKSCCQGEMWCSTSSWQLCFLAATAPEAGPAAYQLCLQTHISLTWCGWRAWTKLPWGQLLAHTASDFSVCILHRTPTKKAIRRAPSALLLQIDSAPIRNEKLVLLAIRDCLFWV